MFVTQTCKNILMNPKLLRTSDSIKLRMLNLDLLKLRESRSHINWCDLPIKLKRTHHEEIISLSENLIKGLTKRFTPDSGRKSLAADTKSFPYFFSKISLIR